MKKREMGGSGEKGTDLFLPLLMKKRVQEYGSQINDVYEGQTLTGSQTISC